MKIPLCISYLLCKMTDIATITKNIIVALMFVHAAPKSVIRDIFKAWFTRHIFIRGQHLTDTKNKFVSLQAHTVHKISIENNITLFELRIIVVISPFSFEDFPILVGFSKTRDASLWLLASVKIARIKEGRFFKIFSTTGMAWDVFINFIYTRHFLEMMSIATFDAWFYKLRLLKFLFEIIYFFRDLSSVFICPFFGNILNNLPIFVILFFGFFSFFILSVRNSGVIFNNTGRTKRPLRVIIFLYTWCFSHVSRIWTTHLVKKL